jgi:hypothetical protein
MNKTIVILSALLFTTISSCDVANQALNSTSGSSISAPKLSNDEVISGLKEALNVGISKAVNLSSAQDGFNKNQLIRIPFPEDAIKVREKAMEWGMSNKVEEFETTLNRAAEEATKEALSIFKDAILKMSISDGFAILNGGNGAATKFLSDNTFGKLQQSFSPIVKNAISKVKLTELWEPIMNKYNLSVKFTGGQQINPDLNNYITTKAISGLFKLVEIEENKIRQDPAARVSDILKKVFEK